MAERQRLQPLLHDLVSCVRAPALALSDADGHMRGTGVHGLVVEERRALHTLLVDVVDRELHLLGSRVVGASEARFVSVIRPLGDPGPDPTVLLEHRRVVATDGATETMTVSSCASSAISLQLRIGLGCDLAAMADIKSGTPTKSLQARARAGGLVWTAEDGTRVDVTADRAASTVNADLAELTWDLIVPAHDSVRIVLTAAVSQDPVPAVVLGEPGPPPWSVPTVRGGDHRLAALVEQSVADLAGLLLRDPGTPGGVFLGAGSPWFLTLFGRDSLIAARMMLPLGTDLALGTLRVLAARQGTAVDATTEEEPGKIAHELRRAASAYSVQGETLELPPLYYGTVDATPLWVILLHDAWRWGLPDAEVAALLDHMQAALAWMRDYATGSGGFLEYVDHSGHGLANQGWKDSGDSIRFADGRLAAPPVALCEVQGYAYQAAMNGASLLEYFGRADAVQWRDWAGLLRDRFRARFWVGAGEARYPAMALDAAGRTVDAVASNMGHLLGTGLLDEHETAIVASRLAGADLDSGYGLRTLSAESVGFNPLGYHTGTVWPHDTAIAVAGLAAEGHHAAAAGLIDGLLRAGPAFDFRLPELFGGGSARDGGPPMPYPAACRPQAWSAAAAVSLLSALAGLRPDVPGGAAVLRPVIGSSVGALTVAGIRVAGADVTVRVGADGRPEVLGLPVGMRVQGYGSAASTVQAVQHLHRSVP